MQKKHNNTYYSWSILMLLISLCTWNTLIPNNKTLQGKWVCSGADYYIRSIIFHPDKVAELDVKTQNKIYGIWQSDKKKCVLKFKDKEIVKEILINDFNAKTFTFIDTIFSDNEVQFTKSTNFETTMYSYHRPHGKLLELFSDSLLASYTDSVEGQLPKIFITDFQIEGESNKKALKIIEKGYNSPALNDIVTLEKGQQTFSITFEPVFLISAKLISIPFTAKYMYKLEGHDTEWTEIDKPAIISYCNMPQGKYAFRIKASSPSGLWNDNGEKFGITIQK